MLYSHISHAHHQVSTFYHGFMSTLFKCAESFQSTVERQITIFSLLIFIPFSKDLLCFIYLSAHVKGNANSHYLLPNLKWKALFFKYKIFIKIPSYIQGI